MGGFAFNDIIVLCPSDTPVVMNGRNTWANKNIGVIKMESVILALVGSVLSLVFQYVPSAKVWFEGQSNKGLVMLALVALVSIGYFALSCLPFALQLGISISCSQSDAIELVKAFFVIAVSNQVTHLFSK